MRNSTVCLSVILVSGLAACSGGGDTAATPPGIGGAPPLSPPPPPPSTSPSVAFSGETRLWHPLTLSLSGPDADEAGTVNPFTDYAFSVEFVQGATRMTVPGYFAACGEAAETGCTSGDQWRVHFTPHLEGSWTYEVAFLEGSDVALTLSGNEVAPFHGETGSFTVGQSDKSGADLRAANNGRLRQDNSHYLLYEDGRPFFKLGADSPENTLAYEDFDATPNRGDRRKDWWPHLDDFGSATTANAYLWQGTKGQELLGAWTYLADQGVNAVSFLTFSLGGDDQNIFPHLLKVDTADYNALGRAAQWDSGVHHDRFDVSKLDQWDRVFSYADELGLFLHFKTMETENDQFMDNGAFGRERQIYYRELVARFGHHLALNWNLGEEYTLSTETARDTLAYLDSIDPYDHLRVLHTYPGELDQRYGPLEGNQSALTGASIQTGNANFNEVRSTVTEWVSRSRDANDPWVVALDEPGSAGRGIAADDSYPTGQLPQTRNQADNRDAVRARVLWNTFTAGGAGVEYYYGYQTGCDDLLCEDHETRESKWEDGAMAVSFFDTHIGAKALNMQEEDGLLTTGAAGNNSTAIGVYTMPTSSPQTLAIEAEDLGPNPPGDWVFENDKPGFTGTGYYRWSGPDYFNINGAGEGTMAYVFDIPAGQADDYRFAFRARRISRTDGRTDLNNDIWLRIIRESDGTQVQPNGQSGQEWWKMFFSGSLTNWTWSNSLDRQDGVKLPGTYALDAGRYRLEISGRSTEFHLDRMTLNKGTNRSTNESLTASPDGNVSGTSVSGPGTQESDNYLFAEPGDIYVAYAAENSDDQILDLSGENGSYQVRWYDPRNGGGLQTGSVSSVDGGGFAALGSPPSSANEDWVVLVTRQ